MAKVCDSLEQIAGSVRITNKIMIDMCGKEKLT